METLSPCPLCGSVTGPCYQAESDRTGHAYVVCTNCGLMMRDNDPLLTVFARWNQRPAHQQAYEAGAQAMRQKLLALLTSQLNQSNPLIADFALHILRRAQTLRSPHFEARHG